MELINIAVCLQDAVNSLNSIKCKLEAIKEALDEHVDWEALENPGESLSKGA